MSAATETIAFLANYNSWRRGDETIEMPAPAEIGATIDDAVNLLRKHDDLKARAERAEALLAVANASIVSSLLYNTLKERLFEAEAELAAERARLDWLTMNTHVEPEEYRGSSFSEGGTLWYSWKFSSPRHAGDHASASIDAAMKEGA